MGLGLETVVRPAQRPDVFAVPGLTAKVPQTTDEQFVEIGSVDAVPKILSLSYSFSGSTSRQRKEREAPRLSVAVTTGSRTSRWVDLLRVRNPDDPEQYVVVERTARIITTDLKTNESVIRDFVRARDEELPDNISIEEEWVERRPIEQSQVTYKPYSAGTYVGEGPLVRTPE